MKYCRFEYEGTPQFGWIETIGGQEQITRRFQFPADKTALESGLKKIPSIPLAEAALLAPLEPSKIVCVGRNYREHAAELGNEVPPEPLIFFKPPSAVIGPEQIILRPKMSARVDHEAELGVVIGKRCRNLKADEDVLPYIVGYTCVNDVTARDLQRKDGQWTRGKGFDTFCPVGPWIVPKAEVDFDSLRVRTLLDGEVKQDGSVRDMIFPVDAIIAFVTQFMT